MTWLTISSPTLLPFITKSKLGAISYNPQKVLRQLGYGQSATRLTTEMGISDSINTESQFIGQGKEYIISKFATPIGRMQQKLEYSLQGVLFIREHCYLTSAILLKHKNQNPWRTLMFYWYFIVTHFSVRRNDWVLSPFLKGQENKNY